VNRTDAEALDAADPLAPFVERFARPDGAIYAAGHSLGPASVDVERALHAAITTWREQAVGGWDDWADLALQVGDRLGTALLGATTGQLVVGDSTTVNIFKLASAALDARSGRGTIVVAEDEFPTDRYVLEGLATSRRLRIARTVDEDTALVCRSLVGFRTSRLTDAAADTQAAHAAGALVLWDLSHAVGAVPVALDALGADLAVGCTYKYLNAGPGAPAFAYVRRDLQDDLRQPIWGWFSQRDQFAMGPTYEPVGGIGRVQTGTPPILAVAAVDAAVALIADAGIDAVRAKSSALTQLFVERAIGHGVDVASPDEAAHRGGHVAVRAADADALHAALDERGVVTDVRGDLVRFGFTPLATRYVDVFDAADRLGQALT
jgi:kynureninase